MKARLYTRPASVPPFWILALAFEDYGRLAQDFQLALQAKAIPYRLKKIGPRYHIYTPIPLATLAAGELSAYLRENTRHRDHRIPDQPWPHSLRACLFLTPLLLFYPFQHGARFSTDPALFTDLGALKYNQIFFHQQWGRIFTALTLHADVAHLTGNLFLGGLFLVILARICGYGRAFFLTIICGGLANFINVFFREPGYASLGFSTAVFASLGLIAGSRLEGKKLLLPLAAALGLLAMLGTEGEHTDYGAHISGLFTGFVMGYAQKWLKIPAIPQILWGLAGILVLGAAWLAQFYQSGCLPMLK